MQIETGTSPIFAIGSIILAIATLVGVILQGIVQLRTKKEVAEAGAAMKKEVSEAKEAVKETTEAVKTASDTVKDTTISVKVVDKKVDVISEQVQLVAQHTNSMKDELIAATKELATMKEKARGEDEARKTLLESQARLEATVNARLEGIAEGARAEKEKREGRAKS